MAKNQVFNTTDEASLPVAAGTKSGEPVLVGGVFPGVAQVDIGTGGNPAGYASVWLRGVYELEVPEAVAAVGTPIYIKPDRTLTTSAADNTLFGHSWPVINRGVSEGGTKAADAGTAGTVNVRLVTV